MEEVRTVLKMQFFLDAFVSTFLVSVEDVQSRSNRDPRTANPLGVDATVSRVSHNSDGRSLVIPGR
jgi:hypothetical protein